MVEFREITNDKKLRTEAWHQQFSTWGSPFTIAQWEQLVGSVNDIAAKHGLKLRAFGVIKDGALVAACEVIERRLYVGKGEVATDYGVAAVHTAKEHRKKGYAAFMINSVVAEYRKNLKGQLSLWSDVGDYYARMGFQMLPDDPHLTMSVSPKPLDADISSFGWIDSTEKLSEYQVAHNKQLMNLADATGGQVVEATAAVYEIATRRNIYAKTIQGLRAPSVHGAYIGGAWMTWTYKFHQNTLEIMGAEGTVDEVAELLKAAASTASDEGLEKVEIIETTLVNVEISEVSKSLGKSGLATKIYHRENMIPMAIGSKPWVGAGFYAWY